MSDEEKKYLCSGCGRDVGRENLKVKRAVFKEMGKYGTTVRTRTVSWLCVIPQEDGTLSCLEKDEDWNRPMYSTSPGFEGSVNAREHEAHEGHVA